MCEAFENVKKKTPCVGTKKKEKKRGRSVRSSVSEMVLILLCGAHDCRAGGVHCFIFYLFRPTVTRCYRVKYLTQLYPCILQYNPTSACQGFFCVGMISACLVSGNKIFVKAGLQILA